MCIIVFFTILSLKSQQAGLHSIGLDRRYGFPAVLPYFYGGAAIGGLHFRRTSCRSLIGYELAVAG